MCTCSWQGKLLEPEKRSRIVIVHVVQARGLQAADANGASDAFVAVQLEGSIWPKPMKTKVMKSTLDPVWDEIFRIPVQGRVGQLKLQVFDHDMLSANDFLGLAKISLHMLKAGGEPMEEWISLKGNTDKGPATGEINIKAWMEIEDVEPSKSNRVGMAKFAQNRKLVDEVITDPDDIDLGIYFNIEPPLDARKVAARKAAAEREINRRTKELAMSREEQERQIRARTQRPPWKDKAWERWSDAGANVEYVASRGGDAVGRLRDLYRKATDYELLAPDRPVCLLCGC